MAGFTTSPNNQVAFQDTGQEPVGRILSWQAWSADPSPLGGPEKTVVVRSDDNGGTIPLGQGGCGTWSPILDGSSNGATSGGDNCFIDDVSAGAGIQNDGGTAWLVDATGWPSISSGLAPGSLWNDGGTIAIIPGGIPDPAPAPLYFGNISAAKMLLVNGANFAFSPVGLRIGQYWNDGGSLSITLPPN